MTQRKAWRILSLLLVASLFLLALNFILAKLKPELYLEARRESPLDLAMAQYALMDDLGLQDDNVPNISQKNDRGVYVWPASSVLPEYRKADLSLYRGRAKNEHALEGITVFIDAGEVTAPQIMSPAGGNSPQPSSKPAGNVAPTDPYTGLPVSPYAAQRTDNEEDEEEETTVAPDVIIAQEQILSKLAEFLQKQLESLGAKVVLTRNQASSQSEIAQAAFIGNNLALRFVDELKEQKFKSQAIESLIPYLQTAVSNPDSPEARRVFTQLGVGPDLRLLLDMEKQYKDVCFISLRLGDEKSAQGSRVVYYGSSSAERNGAGELLEERSQDMPAYVAYDSSARRRLAEQMDRNIRQYLPELNYQGKQTGVGEGQVLSAVYNNLTSVEVIVAQRQNLDNMKSISKEKTLMTLAEALAHSTYQFFCAD